MKPKLPYGVEKTIPDMVDSIKAFLKSPDEKVPAALFFIHPKNTDIYSLTDFQFKDGWDTKRLKDLVMEKSPMAVIMVSHAVKIMKNVDMPAPREVIVLFVASRASLGSWIASYPVIRSCTGVEVDFSEALEYKPNSSGPFGDLYGRSLV